MCLYPKLIKNRRYTSTKKNGGVIPAVNDTRTLYIPVGCQKCMECKKQKASGWSVRLQEDIKKNKNAKFVTLTFSEESLVELNEGIRGLEGYELENEIAKKGVRRFLERWRKKYGKSVRHWLVTELGQKSTERIHIHGLIWTDEEEDIKKIWKYGIVTIGDKKKENNSYVSAKTINYIVKYINKVDEKHKEYNSRIFTSSGIGSNYIEGLNSKNNKYKGKDTKEVYTTKSGLKIAMPTYWRNKIYSEKEREQLWLNKLDEEVRWVNGRKINISNGEESYNKVLEEERKINKRLGYGNDEVDWDRKRYENSRRNINKLRKINGQKNVE